jgi:DNA polymerase V
MEILTSPFLTNTTDLQKHWIPFYSSEIACGLFGIADDFVESYLSLDEKFMKNAQSTFYIRASGDSMGPKIEDRDILVVDTSLKIKPGAVGAFFYNDSPICKTYVEEGGVKILRSLNSEYKDIVIGEGDKLALFGVVIGLVRDFF